MNKISIGIDPGKEGFISMYEDGGVWKHYEMLKIGKFIDVQVLDSVFKNISSLVRIGVRVHAVIEDVHAIYGSSAKGTFTFGYVTGLLEMSLVANRIPFTKVQPKTWQKEMWVGIPIQRKLSSSGLTMVNDTKLMSEMAVKRLFPDIDLRRNQRCKINDENKIDAILLTEYCRRNF